MPNWEGVQEGAGDGVAAQGVMSSPRLFTALPPLAKSAIFSSREFKNSTFYKRQQRSKHNCTWPLITPCSGELGGDLGTAGGKLGTADAGGREAVGQNMMSF